MSKRFSGVVISIPLVDISFTVKSVYLTAEPAVIQQANMQRKQGYLRGCIHITLGAKI